MIICVCVCLCQSVLKATHERVDGCRPNLVVCWIQNHFPAFLNTRYDILLYSLTSMLFIRSVHFKVKFCEVTNTGKGIKPIHLGTVLDLD